MAVQSPGNRLRWLPYLYAAGAVFWLIAYDLSQLVLIGVGCLPLRYWRSFRAAKREPTQPTGHKPRDRRESGRLVTTK